MWLRKRDAKLGAGDTDKNWACSARSWKWKGTVKSWLGAYVQCTACKGKKLCGLSAGEGMSKIRALRRDRKSISSWPQWGNGEGVLLRRCWIHPHVFELWLQFTMHISPLTSLVSNVCWNTFNMQLKRTAGFMECFLSITGSPLLSGPDSELIKITEERFCVQFGKWMIWKRAKARLILSAAAFRGKLSSLVIGFSDSVIVNVQVLSCPEVA